MSARVRCRNCTPLLNKWYFAILSWRSLPYHNKSSFGFKNFFCTFNFLAFDALLSPSSLSTAALSVSPVLPTADLSRRFVNFFAIVPTNDWYLKQHKHKQFTIMWQSLGTHLLHACTYTTVFVKFSLKQQKNIFLRLLVNFYPSRISKYSTAMQSTILLPKFYLSVACCYRIRITVTDLHTINASQEPSNSCCQSIQGNSNISK